MSGDRLREALDEAAGVVEAMDIDREMPGETLTPRDRAVFARARRVAYQRIRALAADERGGGEGEHEYGRDCGRWSLHYHDAADRIHWSEHPEPRP